MKRIHEIFTAVAAALLLAPATYAQYAGHEKYLDYPSLNVGVNKYLVNDEIDENGEYTIRLETFTTGSVTKHAIPTDFVLVLDNSGSMLEDCLYGKPRPLSVTAAQMADPNDDYYKFLRPAHTPENMFLNRHCYSYNKGFSMGNVGQAMTENNENVGTGWSYFQDVDVLASPSLYYYYEDDDTYYKINREKSGSYCFLYFTRTNGTKMYVYSDSATHITVTDTRPASDTNNNAENKILLIGFEGDNIYRPVNRVEELKPGFEAFIQSIYDHNQNDEWAPGVTKHQVAIVSFSQAIVSGGINNPSLTPPPSQGLTYSQKHLTRVIKDFAEIDGDNLSSYKSVLDDYFSFRMGTQTFYGLRLATKLLQKLQTQANMAPINNALQTNRNKVVILFTDGEPKEVTANGGSISGGSKFYNVKLSLQEAEVIKAKRTSVSGDEINGKFFSIDFAGSEGASRFLEYLSSNYIGTSVTGSGEDMNSYTYSGTAITPAEDRIYYMDANNEGGLEKAFATIADANTGDTSAHMVSVDVISSNFELPEGVEANGRIKLYTAQCIGTKIIDGEEYLAFAQPVLANTRPALEELWLNGTDDDGNTVWTKQESFDIDNDVECVVTGKQLVFKGFDFANLWCGKDEDTNHHNTQQVASGDPNATYQDPLYRGFKLIAEFPVVVAPDAIGGPQVPTNVFEFSGLFGSNDDGDPQGNAIVNYPAPNLIVQAKLIIQKKGLAPGESAVFIIERRPFDDDTAPYTEFASFILTGEEGETIPEILFDTLSPRFYYRVKETGWSWAYDGADPPYVPSTEDPTLANPIVFENTAGNAKRAEAKAVNWMRSENSETTTVYDETK